MTKSKTQILIIEDEAPIRQLLRFALEPADFAVTEAENTVVARQEINKRPPDLILVDWMLPGESGVEFIKHLKAQPKTHSIPIILLTARAEETNKLQGFDIGADDYVTKPFSPRELIARIKSILRRGVLVSPQGIIQFKQLLINSEAHEVRIKDELLSLSPFEYQLLLFFIKNPNKVFSREQLLNRFSENNQDTSDRSIDAHIRRLRSRLKPYSYDQYIQTVRSAGYQWEDAE
jgi:two-component system phosphate regulon response regulator PhoB